MNTQNAPKCKKHRGLKTFLTVICVLLVVLCAVAYIFKDEISFIYSGMTSSEEALASREEENDRKTNELLGQIAEVTMRDLTDEERKLLADGVLSYEDALALIMGEPHEPAVTNTGAEVTEAPDVTGEVAEAPDVTVEVTQTAEITERTEPVVQTTVATTKETSDIVTDSLDVEKYQNRINEIIAEIYLLRATYLNKIDELISSTKKEYSALPKEQHTLSTKLRMVEKKVMPAGNALEKECDASMNILLDELKDILKIIGSGTDIIKEIEKTYAEQKEIKKAELISKYMPRINK